MAPLSMHQMLAALFAALALGQQHASAMHVPDGQDVIADNVEAEDVVLRYGSCYTIKNKDGDELGHSPVDWGYLRFGEGTKKTQFKVCQNLGECEVPNTSFYRQTLRNRARFYLFDLEGNAYSKKGEYVAANSMPFWSGGLTYPGGLSFRYYVSFWGENDCSEGNFKGLGECAVKLHVDNLRDDKGLVVEDRYFKVTPSEKSSVTVRFHEVDCPKKKEATNAEL